MVLLPIFETKLLRELREKWEFLVTKQDSKIKDSIELVTFFEFLEGYVLSKEAREIVG